MISCVDIGEATDSMDSNVTINTYPSFERISLDRGVLRTALAAMSVVHFDVMWSQPSCIISDWLLTDSRLGRLTADLSDQLDKEF